MKKNEKISVTARCCQWIKSPNFLKNLFIFIAFLLLLTLSVALFWKRHAEKKPISQQKSLVKKPVSPSPPSKTAKKETPLMTTARVKFAPKPLNMLDKNDNPYPYIIQPSYKIITIELLKSTLEGWIALASLKKYLQKNPEPWGNTLLTNLKHIHGCLTYPQLEDLLVLQPPPKPTTLWGHFKDKLKHLIHVRKLNKKGGYELDHLKDIRNALQEQDVKKALKIFSKLDPEEQLPLLVWEIRAKERFKLETMYRKLIIDLAEGRVL